MEKRSGRIGAVRLAMVLAVVSAASVGAQAHVVGHVRDSTGRGLVGALVMLEGTTHEARADSVGTFHLIVPPANYSLLVRHVGYRAERRAVSLSSTDTVRALITLAVSARPELDTVVVRSDREYAPGRAGFAHRRMLGFGKFLDAPELRKRDGRELSNVLRQLGGIRIERHPHNPNIEWAVHPFGGCFTTIMLDNVWIFRGLRGEEPPNIRKLIQVMDLDGIEYYRGGASLPTEFSSLKADCGVLVLWTRRGDVGGR